MSELRDLKYGRPLVGSYVNIYVYGGRTWGGAVVCPSRDIAIHVSKANRSALNSRVRLIRIGPK